MADVHRSAGSADCRVQAALSRGTRQVLRGAYH
jgi:hypothetical protein